LEEEDLMPRFEIVVLWHFEKSGKVGLVGFVLCVERRLFVLGLASPFRLIVYASF
jgi:hypothetical protein